MGNSKNNHFIVGTRGSKLAVGQTEIILAELKSKNPEATFELKLIQTSGDLGLLQQLGAFTREVESCLLNKEVDFAVHSLKDLPTEHPEGLVIASIPKREDVRDVLITKNNMELMDLPTNPKIGTSSERRGLQIKRLRPDAEIVPLNGNIFSRMEKAKNGAYDGIILALAGLNRVGEQGNASQIFSIEEMIPAVAQGALALQCREDDERSYQLLNSINDNDSQFCVELERNFLQLLGGGCRLPMAAFAQIEKEKVIFSYFYLNNNYIQNKGVIIFDKTDANDEIQILSNRILRNTQEEYFPLENDFLDIYYTSSNVKSGLLNSLLHNSIGINLKPVNEIKEIEFDFPNPVTSNDVLIISSKNGAEAIINYYKKNKDIDIPAYLVCSGENTANHLSTYFEQSKIITAKRNHLEGCLEVLQKLTISGNKYWICQADSFQNDELANLNNLIKIESYIINSIEITPQDVSKNAKSILFTSNKVFDSALNLYPLNIKELNSGNIFVLSKNMKNHLVKKGINPTIIIVPYNESVPNIIQQIKDKIYEN